MLARPPSADQAAGTSVTADVVLALLAAVSLYMLISGLAELNRTRRRREAAWQAWRRRW